MTRFLFWLALAVLVLYALNARSKRKRRARGDGGLPANPGGGQGESGHESMLGCAHCGVHFPESEAHRRDGLAFCSPEHLRLHGKP